MQTVLLVGAGLTSATVAASLQKYAHDFKCICVDVRDHIAGNCYDYKSNGTYISRFGPHLWHSSNPIENNFISQYSNFVPYTHFVTAELQSNITVPFPYSRETENKLGRKLSEDEIINEFFKPYSKKMWDIDWNDLPNSVKGRVPTNSNEKSLYFPNQFCGVPKNGYTELIHNMFGNTEIILGVGPREWQDIHADIIVYCGRLDRIVNKKTNMTLGTMYGKWLKFRNLKFNFVQETWSDNSAVINFCNSHTPYTRKTCYRKIFGGNSDLVSYELPYASSVSDVNPYYPIPTKENYEIHSFLEIEAKNLFPNMIIAGRTSQYVYMDMNVCVSKGLQVTKNILKKLT